MADLETGIQTSEADEAAATTQEKVFTQDDLDAIVADRLRRERKKYADYDKYKKAYEAGLSDEQNAKSALEEMRARVAELEAEKSARDERDAHTALVEKVLADKGIDHKFAPLLTADDEEGLIKQALLISETPSFSEVSRKEGGRPAAVQSGGTPEEIFKEWADSNLPVF